VVREVGFAKLHVFSFSARRGTPAAEMSPVPAPVIRERYDRLIELGKEVGRAYAATLQGRALQVMLEGPGNAPGTMVGTACRYVPVQTPAQVCQRGTLVRVSINSTAADHLEGRRI
jgi:tRNA A37 methylthiotransferase MiaB